MPASILPQVHPQMVQSIKKNLFRKKTHALSAGKHSRPSKATAEPIKLTHLNPSYDPLKTTIAPDLRSFKEGSSLSPSSITRKWIWTTGFQVIISHKYSLSIQQWATVLQIKLKRQDSLGCSPLSIFLSQTNDTISYNFWYTVSFDNDYYLNVENERSVIFIRCQHLED